MRIQDRINDPEKIDYDYIGKSLKSGKHVIVQFSKPFYNAKKLETLNQLCDQYDENFGVRFYGHYSSPFDCKVLEDISNVKCLYVDCLTKADNLLALTDLKHIKKLSLGIFELKEVEILNASNLKRLTELYLTDTKTKALNLEYLGEYSNLKSLILGGHSKNIEAVGELSNLEYLSFNSLKKTPVPFVNRLKKLKTLKFILGGRENINEIEENEIQDLEIIWVRGFSDLGNISKFKRLNSLSVEDNIQLTNIHFDQELPDLKVLKIVNCKSLAELTGLNNLTAISELVIYKTNLDFQKIINQDLPKSLKTLVFSTAKEKTDKPIKQLIESRGFKTR